MSEPRQRFAWWTALVLAIACPLVWLSTAWHLAVEDHHHHDELAVDDHDHDHDHDDDHDAPDGEVPHDEGHHAGDHLIPTFTRPASQAPVVLFVPTEHVAYVAPRPVCTVIESPPDEVGPATDPPLDASRPRAPPVA